MQKEWCVHPLTYFIINDASFGFVAVSIGITFERDSNIIHIKFFADGREYTLDITDENLMRILNMCKRKTSDWYFDADDFYTCISKWGRYNFYYNTPLSFISIKHADFEIGFPTMEPFTNIYCCYDEPDNDDGEDVRVKIIGIKDFIDKMIDCIELNIYERLTIQDLHTQ